MLKIRRPLGRLIFNMGIAIPGKTVFLIETAPSTWRETLGIKQGTIIIVRILTPLKCCRFGRYTYFDDMCQQLDYVKQNFIQIWNKKTSSRFETTKHPRSPSLCSNSLWSILILVLKQMHCWYDIYIFAPLSNVWSCVGLIWKDWLTFWINITVTS